MKTCFEYFNKIRSDLMNDAYIKIVYHWKKYKVSYRNLFILYILLLINNSCSSCKFLIHYKSSTSKSFIISNKEIPHNSKSEENICNVKGQEYFFKVY